MLQGQYEPQTQAGKLVSPSDDKASTGEAPPAGQQKSEPNANQAPDKDGKTSPKNKEHRGTVVTDDNTSPYRTVSYGDQSESSGAGRGPVPIVPHPRSDTTSKSSQAARSASAAQSSHTGKEEKNRSRQDAASDPDENTLSDRVFRSPTLTRPVSDDERSDKSDSDKSDREAPAAEQKGSIKKNSASGDDSKAGESGTSGSDDADGYVSVIEPAKQAQWVTQRSGVHLASGSSSPIYGPVGGKGTIPMNFDRPSYGM